MSASISFGAAASNVVVGTTEIHVDGFNNNVIFGSSVTSVSSVKTSGLRREEWSLLEEEYEDEGWLTPLPWVPECRFDPEDFYVSLNLDDQGRDVLRPRNKKAELENLFDSHVQGGTRLPKRVLLRGGAGFGKTTLCTKVAFDWKWKKTSIRALPWESTLIVHYKLKLFDSKCYLEDVLFNFLYERHTLEGKTVTGTKETLRGLGQGLVLLLDGYDEMDEAGRRQLEALLVACKNGKDSTFSSALFLVTSRLETQKDFLDLFDKHYSIGNLSMDRKIMLVSRYFQNKSIKTEEFFKLHSGLELDEASPLTLFLLCWVSQHKLNDPLTEGRDVFFQCIVLLARRCNDRHSLDLSDKELESFFFRVGLYYYTCTCQLVTLMAQNQFERILKSQQLIFLANNMGILKKSIYSKSTYYDAVHKTFFDSLSQH